MVPKNTHLVSNRCFGPILHGEREISQNQTCIALSCPQGSITYASSGKPVIKAEGNASYSVRLNTGKIVTGGVADLQATQTVQDPSLAISAIEAPPNGSTLFPDSVWKELGHLPSAQPQPWKEINSSLERVSGIGTYTGTFTLDRGWDQLGGGLYLSGRGRRCFYGDDQ